MHRVLVPLLLVGLVLIGGALWLRGGPDRDQAIPVRVFHAAGLTPLLDDLRPALKGELGIDLLAEGSGSQVACRKVAELGRPCDLVMVADRALVAELLSAQTDGRLDFATDEVVLGVGARAPAVDAVETDWPAVLLREDVRLGRVDESQGPIGYRALLVWKLQERLAGPEGLYDRLLAKTDKVVDHVTRLTPLLKSGEVDYAFLYRSICIARDIRHIPLDPRVHLGDPDADYSVVSVTFRKLQAGEPME
ncbi:MAG: substrate-binding domain-containing protein, partial [Planctomycetota bacterium]